MTLLALPEPPNPQDAQYANNAKAYNLAMYRWAQNMKSQLTVDSRTHNRPASTPFSISNYTTSTSLTGTDTTTNVAQVLCTLIGALIGKATLSNKPNNQ